MQAEKLAVNSDISIFDTEPDSSLYQQKLQLDKVRDELMKFGLSSNQAKVFIYLSKCGPKKASDIFKALDLPRTETYGILNGLQSRGIITAEFSTPVIYAALPLRDTLGALVNAEKEKINILAKRESKLVELWNEIPAGITEGKTTRREQLQMLQGNPQIHSKARQMVESAKEEIRIFCTLKDLSSFYHSDLIDMLSSSVADVKFIISPATMIPAFARKINKRRIRLMPNAKTENQCFVVKDSEVLIFLRNASFAPNNVFAIWTDSKTLAESMTLLFDCCWEKSDTIH